MKKGIGVTLCVLVIAGLTLAIIPATRDEIHWRWASYKDQTIGYESYVRAWPEGHHAVEARELYDQRGWADAQAANTAVGFQRYVQLHGESRHAAEANNSIESLHWQEASSANTIRSYRAYTAMHSQGKFAREAEARASALRSDEAPYDAALRAGTATSLKVFLADYPGHQRESEAQQAIKDITQGRDIVDLLKEKKVEIRTQGSGIQTVSLRMRRLVPYSLTARIPVGTYFVSADASSQNMVTTAESDIRLETADWHDVSPAAACANRRRDIPGSEDKFIVQRSPRRAELAKLMPVLDKARADTETRQAAVWIVTDDANYDDLGTLVVSFGFGGSRAINELETARAMKLCDEAGIDITRKRIWHDKRIVLQGLTDVELKKWLQEKK